MVNSKYLHVFVDRSSLDVTDQKINISIHGNMSEICFMARDHNRNVHLTYATDD